MTEPQINSLNIMVDLIQSILIAGKPVLTKPILDQCQGSQQAFMSLNGVLLAY